MVALANDQPARYCPPLAVSVEPVMKPASSDARNTTQRAISLGSPRRPTGNLRNDALLQNVLGNGLDHFGRDVAGADDVDRDAGAGAFLCQGLREADVAGFRCRVVDLAHLAFLAIDRRDVDDATELPCAHAFPNLPGDVEEAVEVGADDFVPLLLRHLVKHDVARDAGIVDEHIDGPTSLVICWTAFSVAS